MAQSSAQRRDRLHLRLDARTKRVLQRAAAYQEKSVTDFVLSSAAAAAEQVIERHEQVTLAPADWDVFFAALVKPPAPNKALRKAVERFRARPGA
jgi:uncharacterized protein (DUF1778 family)